MNYKIRNNVLVITEEGKHSSPLVRYISSYDISLNESVKNYYKLENYEYIKFKFKVIVSVLDNDINAVSIINFQNKDNMNRYIMENL